MTQYLAAERLGNPTSTSPRKTFANYYLSGTANFFETIINLSTRKLRETSESQTDCMAPLMMPK